MLLQAGQIAAAEGAAGLVLHARTADQQYGPPSHWDAVAQLVAAVPASVPVIGNGDVFEAADAVQIMRQTGCQGGADLCIPADSHHEPVAASFTACQPGRQGGRTGSRLLGRLISPG